MTEVMDVRKDKVIVAMSGGVDSSVAAALLLAAGFDVTGVFLCLGRAGPAPQQAGGACCTPADAADARRVAQKLGIDLHVLDVADAFAPIIDHFAAEYARGRTPNPCIRCNRLIKFGKLMAVADSLGTRYVATGHHARRIADCGLRIADSLRVGALAVRADADREASSCEPQAVREGGNPQSAIRNPQFLLARARARGKDQSYALFEVPPDRLERILLPVGEIDGKDEVRRRARELGLPVHDKRDSQEICFVPDDDYAALLGRLAPRALTPGPIIDAGGKVLGRHDGYGRYTVGQRHGLRVAAACPLYVTRIDAVTATVTVGPRSDVLGRRLSASGANWHADVPERFDAVVQVRYQHGGTAARVRLTGPDSFAVEFAEPVLAITPGQAAVVYDPANEVVLGGGWID